MNWNFKYIDKASKNNEFWFLDDTEFSEALSTKFEIMENGLFENLKYNSNR